MITTVAWTTNICETFSGTWNITFQTDFVYFFKNGTLILIDFNIATVLFVSVWYIKRWLCCRTFKIFYVDYCTSKCRLFACIIHGSCWCLVQPCCMCNKDSYNNSLYISLSLNNSIQTHCLRLLSTFSRRLWVSRQLSLNFPSPTFFCKMPSKMCRCEWLVAQNLPKLTTLKAQWFKLYHFTSLIYKKKLFHEVLCKSEVATLLPAPCLKWRLGGMRCLVTLSHHFVWLTDWCPKQIARIRTRILFQICQNLCLRKQKMSILLYRSCPCATWLIFAADVVLPADAHR